MKITYNVEFLPAPNNSGRQSEEVTAVIAFLAAGQKKNMCIEYDDLKNAQNKLGTIRRYRKLNNLQDVIEVYRVEHKIYIVKNEKKVGKK